MRIQHLCATACLAFLAGCGSITLPAAVKMDNGQALTGTTTAAVSGGHFEVSAPGGSLSCKGNYDALDTRPVLNTPVTCSDGRYGTITVIRTPDGMAGSGTVTLASGEKGAVGFGREASSVLTRPTQQFASVGSEYGNCLTPDSIAADGKRCGARAAGYQGASYQTYSRPASSYRTYYRGPRGGCYYLTGSGRKQYVDRSMC